MPAAARRLALLALGCLLVTGCAGFRGGWESVAYLGDTPPALPESPSFFEETQNPPALELPGLRLQVTLDNQLRTYDTQLYLFVLPLYIDPRERYWKNHSPGKTRVFITVTPTEPGFVFRPSQAVLQIGNRRFGGVAGFDFDRWDQQGMRVREGGSWEHRPVATELHLDQPGRSYHLSIDFDTPVPSPESREILLDLSQALGSSRHPALPPIRFVPMRWRRSYS